VITFSCAPREKLLSVVLAQHFNRSCSDQCRAASTQLPFCAVSCSITAMLERPRTLHPAFESFETLQMLRREMGSRVFSAHYLQRPVPQGGAMLQSEWFQYYTESPKRENGSYILQSWDTAAKLGLLNSFSVCTTWLVNGRDYYLLNVFRQKVTYPALRDMAIALAERYKPRYILIEDAMTGSALADELQGKFPSATNRIKPEGDKQVRLFVQSAKFEQSRVWFPKEAPWLRIFLEELLSFPDTRHSDQVDSMSQALAYKPSG
jgi:predicted phage terminase large subunit-like protein